MRTAVLKRAQMELLGSAGSVLLLIILVMLALLWLAGSEEQESALFSAEELLRQGLEQPVWTCSENGARIDGCVDSLRLSQQDLHRSGTLTLITITSEWERKETVLHQNVPSTFTEKATARQFVQVRDNDKTHLGILVAEAYT